ncbi:hypothetical protein HU200_022088 [Digitaria exilis]|uniref:Uncharacterized protein n=1 Tax=Digitaria exilis TaxID=1010633 RepID=A0A835EYK7_9POAL|nr:hypothetical protein HU200_022088 [Digitaria exilis]
MAGSPFFMDIFLIALWEIWKLLNCHFFGERFSSDLVPTF